MLDATARAALVARGSPSARSASGRSSRCSRDPEVDEVMVSGAAPGVGRARAAGSSARPARFATEAELRHAIERILAPLGRRVDEAEPLVRRAAARRLARERGASRRSRSTARR